MAVTVPPSLQPISESPERRPAPEPGARPGRVPVRGHARRTSAPPPHDLNLKPDPATALALAHARLSAAHAETTLQRAAADGLRAANAQLRDENGALRARVRELERRLAERAASTPPEPLTPTGTSSGDSEGPPVPGPAPTPSPADTPRTHSRQRTFRRFSDPPGGRGLGAPLAHDTQTPPAPSPGSPGGTGGLAFDDPVAALWGVYGDLRGADARLDALYTFVRAGGGSAPGAPGPAAAGVRDTHWALFCALQQLQATFARRPR